MYQQRPLEEAVIAAVDVERVLAAGLAAGLAAIETTLTACSSFSGCKATNL